MKVVIAGAGDIGFHIAKLLSSEKHDITLIDTNQEVLDYAATHLDVFTIRGDSSSVRVLSDADVRKADLFLGVTTSEKNNLVSAVLAKKFGAKQTIARVQNQEYLQPDHKKVFAEMGIDSLISPTQLAAQEIYRLVKQCSVTDIFDFEEGKISVIGITLDETSRYVSRRIKDIDKENPKSLFKPIAILRGNETILPRDETSLRRSDHLYFITRKERIEEVVQEVGKELVKVKNIMVLGGGDIGYRTAKLLEDEYYVSIVEPNKERCKFLAENLDKSLIIKGDPGNIELLKEEGMARMDAFIAVSPNSETNIITCLMAEEAGVFKTIAMVENIDYTHISQNIGVDTIINKKLIAANNIFRYVRKGQIEAITSLHGVEAELIEFVLTKNNRVTRKPIKELHLPKNAVIGGVIRGEESMIPYGDFQLQLGDKVIVFCMPEAISRIEQLFR